MNFFSMFSKPKPVPVVIIKNVLGEIPGRQPI
jgi:hypothetical protein